MHCRELSHSLCFPFLLSCQEAQANLKVSLRTPPKFGIAPFEFPVTGFCACRGSGQRESQYPKKGKRKKTRRSKVAMAREARPDDVLGPSILWVLGLLTCTL